jgi:FtsP/CotA-like multicopper oxidase with cupredoxin domain
VARQLQTACLDGVVRRALRSILIATPVIALMLGLGWIGKLWYDSRLPGSYGVMDYGTLEYGGGSLPHVHGSGHAQTGTSVEDLHGPRAGSPDATFTLTAQRGAVQLASGRTIEALTFNGSSPGPELHVRQGDLVEATLVNKDIESGVTIHWHGLDVPNAEDGVAGVTQNAVLPGERYVYRFRAEQVGTFWYHTHQVSSSEVRRGLFGALVIEPVDTPVGLVDLTLVAHTFSGVPTLNGSDQLERRLVAPGTQVRVRLLNTDSAQQDFTVSGVPFRVVAIDGADLNEPDEMEDRTLEAGGGGRVDVAFTMPEAPVRISLVDTGAGLALSSDGQATPPAALPGPVFDPATYGEPTETPFDASTRFDRRFELSIDRKPGFYDGRLGLQWSINGKIFPRVPVFVVEQGDLVEVEVANETGAVHPMHLHGHHVLVLSRDDVPVSGSPWWVDTLNVKPGETYQVGFRADNPGIWMDHCHNLPHAAKGLTMHVAYAGVTTPFTIGDDHHNEPE